MKLFLFFCLLALPVCFASIVSDDADPLADKLNCVAKLFPMSSFEYNDTTTYDEASFYYYCHNFNEAYNCFANLNYAEDAASASTEGVIDHLYTCGLPFMKAVNSLCSIGYKRAQKTRECYDDSVETFKGSSYESQCRKMCCHNARKYDPETPWRCSAGKNDIKYITRQCKEPVVDEKLRENACQMSCMFEAVGRYAKSHCDTGISSVFQSFSKGMKIKYIKHKKCFKMCPLE